MPRQIALIRYSARPFKDHWALFVPSTSNPNTGTLIQVEGDPRNGFKQNVQRNYNVLEHTHLQVNAIGTVDVGHVHDTPSTGDLIEDARDTKDDIERIAMSIPAPGPSMRPTHGNAPPTQRVEFSDCQWWVRKVVEQLVKDGLLPAESITILDSLPRG